MGAQHSLVPRQTVRIREIAKPTGVSARIVSRTINGLTKMVQDNANRVPNPLDFSPNVFFQGLARHKTACLALSLLFLTCIGSSSAQTLELKNSQITATFG